MRRLLERIGATRDRLFLRAARRLIVRAAAGDDELRALATRQVEDLLRLERRFEMRALLPNLTRPPQLSSLHLGCGPDLRSDWLNVDFDGKKRAGWIAPNHLNWDLATDLPFPSRSFAMVYSSHVLEHFSFEELQRVVKESFRVLRSGGVFRAALPNYRPFLAAYVDGDGTMMDQAKRDRLIKHMPPDRASFSDLLSRVLYEYGQHRYFIDIDNISRMLVDVGFRGVVEDDYSEGIDPSAPLRTRYSFYVFALKP